MAASQMLITTQTEAHQLLRETLNKNLGCLPYARLLRSAIRHGSANFLGNSSQCHPGGGPGGAAFHPICL